MSEFDDYVTPNYDTPVNKLFLVKSDSYTGASIQVVAGNGFRLWVALNEKETNVFEVTDEPVKNVTKVKAHPSSKYRIIYDYNKHSATFGRLLIPKNLVEAEI